MGRSVIEIGGSARCGSVIEDYDIGRRLKLLAVVASPCWIDPSMIEKRQVGCIVVTLFLNTVLK